MRNVDGEIVQPRATLTAAPDALRRALVDKELKDRVAAIERHFPGAGIPLQEMASSEYCSAFTKLGARYNELLGSGLTIEEVNCHPDVVFLENEVERLSPFNRPRGRGRPRFSYGKLSVTESLFLLESVLRNYRKLYVGNKKRDAAIYATAKAVKREFPWSTYSFDTIRKILTKWQPRDGKHLTIKILSFGDGGVHPYMWGWKDAETRKLFLLNFESPQRRNTKTRAEFNFQGNRRPQKALR